MKGKVAMKFIFSIRLKNYLFAILLSFFSLVGVKAALSSGAQHYTIDPKNSHFFVYTDTGGFFGGLGHKHKIAISDFFGEAVFDPANFTKASLKITVVSNSLSVVAENKKAEKDKPKIEEKMQTEVLNVATYPNINFRSKEIAITSKGSNAFDATIKGDLTLHGSTRELSIPAKIKLEKDQLIATGEFTLKQTNYSIQPISAMGGAMKVKDELYFTFEMVGNR